jgi:hypothetical protein
MMMMMMMMMMAKEMVLCAACGIAGGMAFGAYHAGMEMAWA